MKNNPLVPNFIKDNKVLTTIWSAFVFLLYIGWHYMPDLIPSSSQPPSTAEIETLILLRLSLLLALLIPSLIVSIVVLSHKLKKTTLESKERIEHLICDHETSVSKLTNAHESEKTNILSKYEKQINNHASEMMNLKEQFRDKVAKIRNKKSPNNWGAFK